MHFVCLSLINYVPIIMYNKLPLQLLLICLTQPRAQRIVLVGDGCGLGHDLLRRQDDVLDCLFLVAMSLNEFANVALKVEWALLDDAGLGVSLESFAGEGLVFGTELLEDLVDLLEFRVAGMLVAVDFIFDFACCWRGGVDSHHVEEMGARKVSSVLFSSIEKLETYEAVTAALGK